MKFRKFLKQWLGYTRRERTGSIVLLFILLSVLIIRTIKTGDRGEVYEHEAEAPAPLVQISRPVRQSSAEAGSVPGYSGRGKVEDGRYSSTDPGLRSDITSGSAYSITKSEDTGHDDVTGQEMSRSDLLSTSSAKVNINNPGWDFVDINTADSAKLEALPGIGPILSARIIKYRYLIGYFYGIDQLNEVYGLDKEVIDMNRNRLKCDSSLVRKININSAAYADLLRHPYINRSQVEAIINFRRLSGSFTDISELKRNRIFNSNELLRLRPYIEL